MTNEEFLDNAKLPGTHPHFEESFCIRMGELNCKGHVKASALCDYMQELASSHAETLGAWNVGSDSTWMLSRLTVDFAEFPAWKDSIKLKTWPSGCRRGLVAYRDFVGCGSDGRPLLVAISEWLSVNLSTMKIARIPQSIIDIAPEGTPHVAMDTPPAPRDTGWIPQFTKTIIVRYADLDINLHANNTKYIDWILEPIRGTSLDRKLEHLDIVFKNGAKRDDVLISECAEQNGEIVHRIKRESDSVVLAVAATRWS